ncbi:MAG: glycoside hydrolase family 5 protein [Muribaculaceae bacterium]|nr:glycoside hydrolase family 5 protein [Muribaculaceae bacterium]
MKRLILISGLIISLFLISSVKVAAVKSSSLSQLHQAPGFMGIKGIDLITPSGEKFFITGTNLGNWLNPEGYMFGFKRTGSPRKIDELFRELAGPEATDNFWDSFRQNYITRQDIEFIANTGANTVRMPFHYKLFTSEPYMGSTDSDMGFEMMDSVVNWCKDNNLYLILDMHDVPGGQTGDNIDDSYGYPWFFRSKKSQQQYFDIWKRIATRYALEPVILGYELMNEPIAHYFDDKSELNAMLEPVYKQAVATIRSVDTNHIILLGGAQWNSIFDPFSDFDFDPLIMYTCHRYGGDASREAIGSFIDFRDRSGRPMYMGEIGHNTMEWQKDFVRVMKEANIGYTFWPYKKCKDSCMMGINMPADWDLIVNYSEGPHESFEEIRNNMPDRAKVRAAMNEYLENIKFKNCTPIGDYIRSMSLTPPQAY